MLTLRLLLCAGLLLLAACGDDIQYAAPPVSDNAVSHAGETAEEHAAHAAADPFADPADANAAAPATAAPSADQVYFSGRVELAPGFTPPATCTIYVMAGPPPKGRPPLLSRRYDKPTFPFEFTLAQSDIPFKDSKVEGLQVLSVILSEKGPVMATEGVYLRCPLETPQTAGATGIVLTIRN